MAQHKRYRLTHELVLKLLNNNPFVISKFTDVLVSSFKLEEVAQLSYRIFKRGVPESNNDSIPTDKSSIKKIWKLTYSNSSTFTNKKLETVRGENKIRKLLINHRIKDSNSPFDQLFPDAICTLTTIRFQFTDNTGYIDYISWLQDSTGKYESCCLLVDISNRFKNKPWETPIAPPKFLIACESLFDRFKTFSYFGEMEFDYWKYRLFFDPPDETVLNFPSEGGS